MKQIIAATFALSLSISPAAAQETPEAEEGFNLMEEGAKMLLRGLMDEVDPAIRDLQEFAEKAGPELRAFAQEMGPAIAEMMNQIDNIRNYQAPEVLPNGDIIIRRKPDAPDYMPRDGDTDIEL